MKKQAWTAILLWMALFSFTLSAQEGGGTTTGLTVTKNSDPPENINGSCIINSSGTYRFTGTYSGTPTAEIGSSEGKAVISVAAGIAGEVTIILENVKITLNGDKECPLSARNATGTVIVQLKGTNTLASTYSGGGGQCPALWAPQTSEGKLIINSSGTGSEVGSLTAKGAQDAPGIGSMSREGSQITINSGTIEAIGGANAAGIGGGYSGNGGKITITGGKVTAIDGSNNNETSGSIFDIKGNTVIVGPDATMVGTLNCSYTNGFVFEENATSAEMKGTATLLADMTIGTDQTLTIPTGASLTIEEKVTLENKGTITNNGTIYKRGAITNNQPTSSETGKIINQTKLIESMITIDPATYTYDGNAATPGVTVSYSDITYTKGTHYTVEYENNKDAGTATVKVTPTDKDHGTLYGETVTKTFTINKATPSAEHFKFTASSELTYDGQAKTATVVAEERFTGMGEITINYYKETQQLSSAPADAGTYTVKISVTDGTNFIASSELITDNNWTFTIAKATPTTPTNLTATYGETLDNVTLPTGWAWEDTTTPVGNVGTNTFHAKYTPTDENYNEVVSVEVSITVTQAEANLSFAQPTLTMTQGNAVPANALTKPEDGTVTYSSSNEAVATVNADGVVTVVGVGTTTITAMAQGNYTGSASYTLTVNSYIPPYIPPTPDPDPIYYTVTIPTEVAGAIIHGGGTHEVEEYTYCSFRIELDPNGNGEYPTVTKGYWWDTLTPDGQGNYSVYVTGNTQITIGEVPTNSYDYYQVTLPTDSVAEADDQYWSGDYIEVTGASPLRAAEEASLSYQAPFGMTVTLRPIETERRKFLQWEDGSKQKERTLTLRADQEIKALWQRISPTGIEAIAAGSVIRGERGQLYIEVPEACDVTLYTYGGVPVRVARLAAGANRLANLNAGLYLVKLGGAPAVPVRIR